MTECHEKSKSGGTDPPCDMDKALEDDVLLMMELDEDNEDKVDESANIDYMEIASSFVNRTAKVVIERMKIYPCTKCSRAYQTNRELQIHIIKHVKSAVLAKNGTKTKPVTEGTFEKKYKCEFCDWRFVCSSTLTTHMKIHDPFDHMCHCGIGYYYEEDLEEHKNLMHRLKIEKVDRRRINQGPWVAKINLKSNKPKRVGKSNNLTENSSDSS